VDARNNAMSDKTRTSDEHVVGSGNRSSDSFFFHAPGTTFADSIASRCYYCHKVKTNDKKCFCVLFSFSKSFFTSNNSVLENLQLFSYVCRYNSRTIKKFYDIAHVPILLLPKLTHFARVHIASPPSHSQTLFFHETSCIFAYSYVN